MSAPHGIPPAQAEQRHVEAPGAAPHHSQNPKFLPLSPQPQQPNHCSAQTELCFGEIAPQLLHWRCAEQSTLHPYGLGHQSSVKRCKWNGIWVKPGVFLLVKLPRCCWNNHCLCVNRRHGAASSMSTGCKHTARSRQPWVQLWPKGQTAQMLP